MRKVKLEVVREVMNKMEKVVKLFGVVVSVVM